MINSTTHSRWAMILAGGGTENPPKHFTSVLGGATLVQKTSDRVTKTLPPEQTLFLLTEHHRPYFTPILRQIPPHRQVVQPLHRGTAPAILLGLRHLAAQAPNSAVAIFPPDHHFSDDSRLMTHVDSAFGLVDSQAHSIVLLGFRPEYPESNYGWIEPASADSVISRVRGFWEKPHPQVAEKLFEAGCLWSSFVIVASVSALIELIRSIVPTLASDFDHARDLSSLYNSLHSVDFSSQVLARAAAQLSVLRVQDVTWSDLGNPARLQRTTSQWHQNRTHLNFAHSAAAGHLAG